MKTKLLFLALVSFSVHAMELGLPKEEKPSGQEDINIHMIAQRQQISFNQTLKGEHKKLFNAILGSKKDEVDQYLKDNPNLDKTTLGYAETLASKIHSERFKRDSCTLRPCWNLSSSQKSALYNMLALKAIFFINLYAVKGDLELPALIIPQLAFWYNTLLLFTNWHEWRASANASDIQQLLVKKVIDLEGEDSQEE